MSTTRETFLATIHARLEPLAAIVRRDEVLHKRIPTAGLIRVRIQREIGLTINMHLFRHMAAMIWLDAHPGQYEVVRRLLGNSQMSQTLNAYAGFEAGTATRLFAQVIDKRRR